MKKQALRFVVLHLILLLTLVALQNNSIAESTIQPRDFFGEFKQSQFGVLDEIQDSAVRKKYTSMVTEHWNGYDTTVLRFVTAELAKLYISGKCSDSLLVLESPSHGAVEHTSYTIYDFKKQCHFRISVLVESIVKVGMSDKEPNDLADSIVYRQLNIDQEKCNQFVLPRQDCFFVSPNGTRSFLQFGMCPEDYDLGVRFIISGLPLHQIDPEK